MALRMHGPGLKIIFKATADNISDGLSSGSDIIRWWRERAVQKFYHTPSPRQIAGDLSVI